MNKQKSLSKNVIISLMNTFVSMIFPLITYPYISRVLQVENIGIINFGSSIVDYFSVFAAFGISSFAVRTGSAIRDDDYKSHLFASQMFSLNVITTSVSFIALILFLLISENLVAYRKIVLVQSIAIFSVPITLEWLYAIYEDFLSIAVRNFIVKIISLFLIFGFVKNIDDSLLYVLIISLSTLFASVINLVHSKKYIRLRFTIKTGWREYKSALAVFLINSISTSIYLNSDKTMLGVFSDDISVGLYTTATNIYTIVKRVVAAGILVVIPRLSYLFRNNKNEFEFLVLKAVRIIIIVSLPMMSGLIILSQDIVFLISGEGYEKANCSLRILSLAIGFAALANLYTGGVLISQNKEKSVMKCTLASSLTNIVLNFICIPLLGENGAAITTLISEIVMAVMAIKYSYEGRLNSKWQGTLWRSLISTMIMSLICLLVYHQLSELNIVIKMGIISVVGVGIYFMVEILLREIIIIEIIEKKLKL